MAYFLLNSYERSQLAISMQDGDETHRLLLRNVAGESPRMAVPTASPLAELLPPSVGADLNLDDQESHLILHAKNSRDLVGCSLRSPHSFHIKYDGPHVTEITGLQGGFIWIIKHAEKRTVMQLSTFSEERKVILSLVLLRPREAVERTKINQVLHSWIRVIEDYLKDSF